MRLVFTAVLFCLIASLVFAADSGTTTMRGAIIDNMCASSPQAKDITNFIKTHTKECALMPDCVASGYSLFVQGKLYKFDADSNTKIESFLKKPESNLWIIVEVKKVGERLSLISIQNQ